MITRTLLLYIEHGIMVKICISLKGHNSAKNDLNQDSVSFTHMFNACIRCVVTFKFLIKYGVYRVSSIIR